MEILIWISATSILIPLTVVLIFRITGIISYLIALWALFQIMVLILSEQGMNSVWIMNIATPLVGMLIGAYYFSVLSWFKINHLVAVITALILVSAASMMVLGIYSYNPPARVFLSLLAVALAVSWFSSGRRSAADPATDPAYWFSGGFLLYYGGNLVFFLFSRQLQQVSGQGLYVAALSHELINIIFNLVLTKGLLCKRRLLISH